MPIKINRSVRLNGLNPLAYIGQNSYTPPDYVIYQRDPTVNDWQDFYVGCIWLNQVDQSQTYNVWMLVSKQNNVAKWIQFINGSGNDLISLTGDTGTNPVFGDVNENINIVGGVGIDTVGDSVNHNIEIHIHGDVANSYNTDFSSPAIPANNILQIKGGVSLDAEAVALVFRKNIHTAANPAFSNLLEVKLNESISLPNSTSNGIQGVYYLGGVTAADRFMHNFGTGNTFLGQSSGNFTLTTGSSDNNTGIGLNALTALTVGADGNVAVGASALQSATTSELNLAAGVSSLKSCTIGDNNVALGAACLQQLVDGSFNTCGGEFAGFNYTGTESYNVIFGSGVSGLVGETGTVRIGAQNGSSNTDNTFVGYTAGNSTYTLATGTNNTFTGSKCGSQIVNASANSGYGVFTLNALTSGQNNSSFGWSSMPLLISGNNNTACGAGGLAVLTSGSNNTAVSAACMGSLTSGNGNNAIGDGCLDGVVTGSYNLAWGLNAADAYLGAESSNIILSNNGVLGESNTIRIGTSGNGNQQQNTCYIAGIRGITTGNNDAVAVLIDSAGQLGTVSSSARYKENIVNMGSLSEDIYKLRPVVFNYKKHSPEHKSVGLIAEEVNRQMPCLVIFDEEGRPETVKYQDLVPMLLNELKKLRARVEKLESN